jgi:chromate transporter
MTPIALYWLFLRAVLLSFSGFATVPVLREALVLDHGVLTDSRLNDAIAISQASPGPLGLYLVVVGYFVAGISGAVAGVLALASPALLAIPIARIVARGQSATLQGACSGIVIAACALMVVTGVRFVPEAAPTMWHLGVITIGAAVLIVTTIKPVWVILAAAVAGAVLR